MGNDLLHRSPQPEQSSIQRSKFAIQVEVLNACGITKAGTTISERLRQKHIDVVQSDNYFSFDIPHTLIIDRIGDMGKAKFIAQALGIDSTNIISQMNKEYYLDASVLIGKDYTTIIRTDIEP